MEDILASIRRIIADDQEPVQRPQVAEVPSSPLKNVLDLAERHISPILHPEPLARDHLEWAEAATSTRLESIESVSRSGQPGGQAPYRVAPTGKPAASEIRPEGNLISGQAEACLSEGLDQVASMAPANQPQTVEALMKEMLRPMLKAWLDDNLPTLVERLVQAEIDRVARGRG